MKGKVEPLPNDIKNSMIEKKIWQEECPVSLDDLRLVKLEHYDFFENVKQGELVVHKSKAQNILAIFQDLYSMKFPINQVKLIDDYNGDDDASMADNNSSCFNYRKIAGTNTVSMHGYGLAIDINPMQNPMITLDDKNVTVTVHPAQGMNYLNRTNDRPGMVEPIVGIFKTHGFDVWGGSWNTPVDYHHFQVERSMAEVMGDLISKET